MLGEEYILQAKFFKKIQYFFQVKEINVDFVKGNNFFFILYFEMCKNIIFIFMYGLNMCFV